VKVHPERGEIVRQDVLRESRLLLVEIDGDQTELDRRAALQ
jgi:hypothetical protein